MLPIYTVAAADVGHTLRVNVIATNIAGKGEAESEPTALVAGVLPANVIPPLIAGLTITGQTLTATEGTWTGTEPISYAFQWELCRTPPVPDAKKSPGATKSTFTIPDGDAGHTLPRRSSPLNNVAGEVAKTSEATAEVLGVGSEQQRSAHRLRDRHSRPAPDRLERQMDRHRTDPLRIRMAALQHGRRRNARRPRRASLLPTYSVAGADVGHTLRVKVIAKNIAGIGRSRIGAHGDGRRRHTRERRSRPRCSGWRSPVRR